MPKGYKKPADWDGFAMAAADAMFEQELALVRRDAPPTYDALREQLEAAERSAREMHIAADRFLRERDALRSTLEWVAANADERVDALRAEVERLNAIITEAMAQNERFDKRYRDAEAEIERIAEKNQQLLAQLESHGW